MERNPRYLLITYHGTVVYFDRVSRCLRHGNIKKYDADVYADINGHSTLLFWQDGGISRPIGAFGATKCTISDKSEGVRLSTTKLEANLFAFGAGEYFICAEPNGDINSSRLIAQTWESFLLIETDDFSKVNFIVSNTWLTRTIRETVEVVDAQLLPSHQLRVGRLILPVHDVIDDVRSNNAGRSQIRDLYLTFDKWKVEHFVLYRPIVYFCAFGKDEIFSLLRVAVESLFEFGDWEGDVLIITESARLNFVRQMFEPFGSKILIEILPAEDVLDFTLSRYKVTNINVCAQYQPMLYLDTDVVCDVPVNEYMKQRAFSLHLDVVEEFPLGHPLDFYGKTLFENDGRGYAEDEIGVSSGVFSFRNIDDQSQLFRMILNAAMKASEVFGRSFFRFFDQPFFNYILYKTHPAISAQLSSLVHLHLSNSSLLTDPVRKGFVHFAGGVGNSEPKITQMIHYVDILRKAKSMVSHTAL